MAESGGQPGNTNAVSKKPWAAAIQRALEIRSIASKREALDDLAEKLLAKCDEGEIAALKELADRLDGKSVATLDIPQGLTIILNGNDAAV